MLKVVALIAPLAFLVGCNAPAKPFPTVIAQEVEITLTRSACFGNCPDYTVTLDGQGNVKFSTQGESYPGEAEVHREFSRSDGVLLSGVHTDKIDPKIVSDLVERFRDANFFSLKDEYVAEVTDNPTYSLTIDTGTRSKTVVDYVGDEVGMPAVVTELQQAVDLAAGTARWVEGADGLVEWLDAEGFDYTSSTARAVVLEGAIQDATDRTIIAMIGRGVDLNGSAVHPWRGDEVTLGPALLSASIMKGRSDLFVYLADQAWIERSDKAQLEKLFADSAGGCSPSLVRSFARRGLNVDAIGEEGETALAALAGSYECESEDTRAETAQALLVLGADPNKRDAEGETAIFEVEHLPLLDLLYSRGATAKVTDKDGNSPVFSSWTDEIVLRHLKEGASPVGRYYDGRTLKEQMKSRPMPQTKKWLEANADDQGW